MTKADKELADLEEVFGALAHASRRQILLALWLRGGSLSAGQIAERFSCKWPTITRHLTLLVSARLITVRKDGRERIYTLDRDRLTTVVTRWLHWFDGDPPRSPLPPRPTSGNG
jgi:DNA-binding transcriptional ArsR family regulator